MTLCGVLLIITPLAEADETPLNDSVFNQAVTAYKENRFKESQALFEKLARKFPENTTILNNLALIAIKQGSTARAVNLLKRTIATDAVINTAYFNLSAIYAHLASVSYRKALSLESLAPNPLRLKFIDTTPQDAPSPIPDVADAVTKAKEVNEPLVRDPAVPGPESGNEDVIAAVMRWAQAWSRQDLNAYFSSYIDGYAPSSNSHRDWKAQRSERLKNPEFINVTVSGIRAEIRKKTQAQVTFRQKYRSNILSSLVTKQLDMENVNNAWKITAERVL